MNGSSFWVVWWGDMLLWQWDGMQVCHIVKDAARHHNAAHLFGTVQQHTPGPVQAASPSLQQTDGPERLTECGNGGHCTSALGQSEGW